MLSVILNVQRQMARCLMNSELERIWKKAAGDYFDLLFCVYEGTEKNLQSGQGAQFSGPGHNCRVPEYDSEGQMCRSGN